MPYLMIKVLTIGELTTSLVLNNDWAQICMAISMGQAKKLIKPWRSIPHFLGPMGRYVFPFGNYSNLVH